MPGCMGRLRGSASAGENSLMLTSADLRLKTIEMDGFVLVSGVFSAAEVAALASELSAVLNSSAAESVAIQSREGDIYAARNVLALWPATATIWQRTPLTELLSAL